MPASNPRTGNLGSGEGPGVGWRFGGFLGLCPNIWFGAGQTEVAYEIHTFSGLLVDYSVLEHWLRQANDFMQHNLSISINWIEFCKKEGVERRTVSLY